MRNPRHVLITGATSGIGAALARSYAVPGRHLTLNGRNSERLALVAALCRASGAVVRELVLDVADRDAATTKLLEVDGEDPVDLLIANAGISGGTHGGSESADQVRAIFATNVDGVLNTVLPLLPRMEARRRGQIALMASLAGHRGFPGAPAYCGSKAAIKVWGEGLRGQMAAVGVEVTVVMPGYIETPMTDANDFPMPLMMSADRAAALIRDRLARNPARIAFPWPTAVTAWLLGALSPRLTDPLLRRLPKKA
ncbi:MAG TPA: SDR family NAD(P)-dependent oxidoreductase [Terriglobia bacterium]|nr:SDR family NAD(P)-dependent oxidoreductase [Terriglobia bacterium]